MREWRDRELSRAHFGDARKLYTEAFAEWSAHIAANVRASTAKRYGVSLKQLAPWLLPLYLDEVNKALVGKIVAGRREAGVSNATLRRDLTALSSLLEFHDRDDNPALRWLKRLDERRDPIVLPELVDIERVANRAPGNLAALIRAARITGCRQNELVTAERRLFNYGARQLTVIGKGRKLRVIDLTQDAADLLASIPAAIGSQWLFWHDRGQPYRNVASRFRVFVRAVETWAKEKRTPFRPFRFHDLRHYYAVDYLRAGGNIYDLQRQLGHGSIKTTEMYLAYLTPDDARRAKYETAHQTAQRRF